MTNAAKKAIEYKKGSSDIGVSVDGTWQRRGYTSMNGVITAISIDIGQIVDVEIMSRYCRQCAIHSRLLNDDVDALNSWKEKHKESCTMNHEGSAPSMECEGATRMFKRSEQERGVRYTEYYGDGDSKGYESVKDNYTGIVVEKKECIGH